LAAS